MKKKKTKQQAVPVAKIDSWHLDAFCLENLTTNAIADAFSMMFNEKEWRTVFDRRCRLFNSISKMEQSGLLIPSQKAQALKALEACDEKIADFMLKYLADFEVRNRHEPFSSFDDVKREYSSVEGAQEIWGQIGEHVKLLTAVASMAESVVLDIRTLMRRVTGNGYYADGDGLLAGLRQIRNFLDYDNRNKPQELKDMWVQLYDSLEANAIKRIKAAYKREDLYMKKHPVTKEWYIQSLNQLKKSRSQDGLSRQ